MSSFYVTISELLAVINFPSLVQANVIWKRTETREISNTNKMAKMMLTMLLINV